MIELRVVSEDLVCLCSSSAESDFEMLHNKPFSPPAEPMALHYYLYKHQFQDRPSCRKYQRDRQPSDRKEGLQAPVGQHPPGNLTPQQKT